MSPQDNLTEELRLVRSAARVWRRKEAELEAARDAFNAQVVHAVREQKQKQRDVAQAAQISEPLVRKILTTDTVEKVSEINRNLEKARAVHAQEMERLRTLRHDGASEEEVEQARVNITMYERQIGQFEIDREALL